MKKITRIVSAILASSILFSTLAVTTNAKSLAESFYSGTDIVTGDYYCTLGGINTYQWYTKKCHAGTSGYSPFHYVRAWIGGSSSAPDEDTKADTGRCWFYGDGFRECSYKNSLNINNIIPFVPISWYFPVGHAKYGN